jgi:urea transporter
MTNDPLANQPTNRWWWVDAILHAYSILFFTQKKWLGACLLVCTFVLPSFAWLGLVSVVVALIVGVGLGFDRSALRNGSLLFNSLLVGMTVAYLRGYQEIDGDHLLMLVITASLLALFVSVMMNSMVYNLTGLPAMSLPFVVVSMALFFLFFSLNWMPVVSSVPQYLIAEPSGMSVWIHAFFQSFGALLFIPHAGVGVVLFVALLVHSRLAGVYAVVAFAAGVWFLAGFGYEIEQESLAWVTFNLVLTGIALGGGFFVPSRSSLALVVLGSFFCASIAIAVRVFLLHFNIPPLALPFNLVVLMMVYALRLRTDVKSLHASPIPGGEPERNFRKFASDQVRFADAYLPELHPPFSGDRVVTQGVDGGITHRDAWKYALDFEVVDLDGQKSEPSDSWNLEDYYTYGSPVLAPCNGQVVRVIQDVEDNPVGGNDLQNNWGNLVILRTDAGLFVKLCHFKKEGVNVAMGDHVVTGALLGVCGNSGRSPIPHLHMQMQTSDEIGSATIPFRLVNYQKREKEDWLFCRRGLPEQDARISAVIEDRKLAMCFEQLLDRQFVYDVEIDGQTSQETISVGLDVWGNFLFQSRETGVSITARIIDCVFTVLDVKGSKNSILLIAWPALQRIPLIRGSEVKWREKLDLSVLDSPWLRVWKDLYEPFVGVRFTEVQGALTFFSDQENLKQWQVEANMDDGRKVGIRLGGHCWMTSGEYRGTSREVKWAQIQ